MVMVSDGFSGWVRVQYWVVGAAEGDQGCSLKRVTGGANGLGEHIRSFTKEDKYTPAPSWLMRLKRDQTRMKSDKGVGGQRPRIMIDTHANPSRSYPKKYIAGKKVMKNVCVPKLDVYTK